MEGLFTHEHCMASYIAILLIIIIMQMIACVLILTTLVASSKQAANVLRLMVLAKATKMVHILLLHARQVEVRRAYYSIYH